ncbi:hypothetical protein HDU87_005450 [Geranomyces variabilis]|uniref:Uncharacterized protein n=1 Tax=Geranomyces variabilis TaxID=109894 RepID=A0AAD5THC7_9FUNG|nr:hypothetical protein HDU87_005450 [Geranomyces variabilis]
MAASKEDYLQIVAAEETEIFVLSLVEHVVVKSQDVLFEKHIESQVLPYAVQFAKGALDELVEWEFFRQDEGAIDAETWEPDEEPEPAACDSWSPGMIPIRKVPVVAAAPMSTAPAATPSLRALAPTSPSHTTSATTSATSSRMELASAASLTASSASLGRRRYPSGGNSGRRGTSGRDGSNAVPVALSATQIAEMAIQEENKKTLARLRSQEKEGGKPLEWSYDHNGRVVVVKKTGIGKQTSQSIRAKIIPAPPDAAAAAAGAHPQGPAKTHAPGIPAAAEASHKASKADRNAGRVRAAPRSLVAATNGTGKPPPKAAPAMPAHHEQSPRRFQRQRHHQDHPAGAGKNDTSATTLPPQHEPGAMPVHRRAVAPGLRKEPRKQAAAAAAAGSQMSLFDSSLEANTGFVEDLSLQVPSLTETMKLAPGVVLRENDNIKRGAPPSYVPNAHPKYLPTAHPMPLVPRCSSDPLAAVLARARPVIRRMVEPLPGIGEGRAAGATAPVAEKREGVSAGQ